MSDADDRSQPLEFPTYQSRSSLLSSLISTLPMTNPLSLGLDKPAGASILSGDLRYTEILTGEIFNETPSVPLIPLLKNNTTNPKSVLLRWTITSGLNAPVSLIHQLDKPVWSSPSYASMSESGRNGSHPCLLLLTGQIDV